MALWPSRCVWAHRYAKATCSVNVMATTRCVSGSLAVLIWTSKWSPPVGPVCSRSGLGAPFLVTGWETSHAVSEY